MTDGGEAAIPAGMRLLAIDTALEACSVGVVANGKTVMRSEIIGRGHAEILMGMIEDELREAALTVADLDRIAVTVGPGSFTGLRVGIAAARGLALVLGKPAVGIGTLAVHAEEARAARGLHPALAVIAAGRGEIYGAVYAADGRETLTAQAGSPEVFAAEVTDGMLIAGSGADLILAALPMDSKAEVAHRHSAPDIAALCRLALAAPAPTAAPRPLYLRAPDAKPQGSARVARR
jgi:tRNA threonylcarbamoyladenosine biosynthesis protein TsaB